MSDQSNVLPQFLHPYSLWGPGGDVRLHGQSGAPGSITVVASQAYYIPISIPWPYPVKRVFWINGSVITAANSDFGIYTSAGRQIYHTGSTAQAGVSAPQYVTPSPDFILDAGNYYFAWACDATTNHAQGQLLTTAGQASISGLLIQTGLTGPTLPATATFADPGIVGGIISCGVTRTPSGF